MEEVILVNEKDEAVGAMEKLEAHRQGLLHRAFSVFIFNSKGEMLLQQRALNKYHSAGLWTNACCSHPRPGEDTRDAAQRRLREEMGLYVELSYLSVFTYKTEFGNGLTEHEVDHVYLGKTDAEPKLNPEEAESYCWKTTADIKEEIAAHPAKFTSWFKIAIEKLF